LGVVSGSRCGADMLARVLPWVRRKELGERRGKGGESSKPTRLNLDESSSSRSLAEKEPKFLLREHQEHRWYIKVQLQGV